MAGQFPASSMPDADWWAALWPDPAGVLEALRVGAGSTAVDLCCGDGLFTLPLARIARRVFAIDLDAQLLERARARLARAGIGNCELIAADAMALTTLVQAEIDLVFMANTFHGVPDQRRLCEAVAAVLRPGGLFAIVNWHRRPRDETTILGQPRGPQTEMRMTPAETAAVVVTAGLSLERLVELPPYHYGAVFGKAGAATPLA